MTTARAVRHIYRLIRADDQVDLQVELIDLAPTAAGSGHDLIPVAGGYGYLVLSLAPQHVLESAKTRPEEFSRGQLPVFGYDTVLVFEVPPGGQPIPFTVEGILGALPRLKLVTDSKTGSIPPLPAPPPVPATAVVAVGASSWPRSRARRRRSSTACSTCIRRQGGRLTRAERQAVRILARRDPQLGEIARAYGRRLVSSRTSPVISTTI